MDAQKGIITRFGEWWDQQKVDRRQTTAVRPYRRFAGWLPSRGSFIFTLLMIGLLLWAQTAGALPLPAHLNAPEAPSTGTIAYQGRLADSGGNPLTAVVNMEFRLYSNSVGGVPLWEEPWTGPNAVQVSDGLFNVMLGSLTPIPQTIVTGNGSLWLGITVGTDDEMTPRVQLGSVPFAVQALTVPDGTVTTEKIADGAVTMGKLGADVSFTPPDGSITTAKIADGAITAAKAPSLLALAVGTNTKVYYGWDNIAASQSTRTLSKTVSLMPICQRPLYVFIQPQAYYTLYLSTTIDLNMTGGLFTVNFARTDNLNWENGTGQGFFWLALCG